MEGRMNLKALFILAILALITTGIAISAVSDDADAKSGTNGGVDWHSYSSTIEMSPSSNPQDGFKKGVMPDYDPHGTVGGHFWVSDG